MDLILRPTYIQKMIDQGKTYCLQFREHTMAETNYQTICYISEEVAVEMESSGKPYFLFGHPNENRKATP